MSIQDLSIKFKGFLGNTEVLLAILLVVVALVSFVLGRLSVSEQGVAVTSAIPTHNPNPALPHLTTASSTATSSGIENVAEAIESTPREAGYVASKNGTKYHLPWCGSANQIKEENKIWFATKAEAEKAGYTPAANCKGI